GGDDAPVGLDVYGLEMASAAAREQRLHDASIAEAGVERAVRPVANEAEARGEAVRLAGEDDLAVALERQGMGVLEGADLGRRPASLAERLVELARGCVAEDAEGRVRVSALHLTDGQDFSVGLDLHVLGSLRPVRGGPAAE